MKTRCVPQPRTLKQQIAKERWEILRGEHGHLGHRDPRDKGNGEAAGPPQGILSGGQTRTNDRRRGS